MEKFRDIFRRKSLDETVALEAVTGVVRRRVRKPLQIDAKHALYVENEVGGQTSVYHGSIARHSQDSEDRS